MTDYSHYGRLTALPPLVRQWLECRYDGPIPLSAIEQAERNQAAVAAVDDNWVWHEPAQVWGPRVG